jgi:hypothetical protein
MLAKTVKMVDSQKQTYINKARDEYIERELYLYEQRKQERENELYILEQNRMFQEQEEETLNKINYDQQKLINKAKEGFYSRFDEDGKIINYYNNLEEKIKNAKRINNNPNCKINYTPNVDRLINKQKKEINNLKCPIKKSNNCKPSEARNNAKQKISLWEK